MARKKKDWSKIKKMIMVGSGAGLSFKSYAPQHSWYYGFGVAGRAEKT